MILTTIPAKTIMSNTFEFLAIKIPFENMRVRDFD